MLERLTFLSLAAVLCAAPACIIQADDDNASSGNDSGNATDNATGNATDNTTGNATDNATGNATDNATGNATGANDSTGADDTAGTAGPSGCGWGSTNDPRVPEGYICGGEGDDPDGMFDLDCPDQTLEVGAECGDVTGVGCCDADGNVWFCGASGDGQGLALDDCSA